MRLPLLTLKKKKKVSDLFLLGWIDNGQNIGKFEYIHTV